MRMCRREPVAPRVRPEGEVSPASCYVLARTLESSDARAHVLHAPDLKTAIDAPPSEAEALECCRPLTAAVLSDNEGGATTAIFRALAEPPRVRS